MKCVWMITLDPSKHSVRRELGPLLSRRDTHLQAAPELLLEATAAATGMKGVDGVHELLGVGRLESGSHLCVASNQDKEEREFGDKEDEEEIGYFDYICP